MKEKVRNKIYNLVKELRSDRGSTLMFFPKSISLKSAFLILANEVSGRFREADEILISEIFKDLIQKKILHKNCLKYYEYKLGDMTYFDVYLKTTENQFFCRGTSTDRSQAYAKALGEVFERTSIKFPSKDDIFISKCVKDIENDPAFVDISLFPQATEKQKQKFPNSDIKDEDVFQFIKVKRDFDNSEIYLPAQSIFYGFAPEKTEKKINQQTTNGAGAGFTKQEAYFSGLLEIVHRNFFLKSWYFKNSPDRIKIESLKNETELYKKIKSFESRDFKIHFLDYTTESKIPTTICILERFSAWYCGGSSSDKLIPAIERSLDEAMSTYLWSVQTTVEGNNSVDENFILNIENDFLDEKMNAKDRMLVFADKFYINKINKFILNGSEIEYSDKYDLEDKEKVNEIAQEIFSKNIFVHEKENSYLKEYNYNVTRVVIPNSYYFALDEIFSRPVLGGIQPTNTTPNPFP